MSENKKATLKRGILIILSALLFLGGNIIYNVFRNETEIEAGIRDKYIEENDIDMKDYYIGTSAKTYQQEVEAKCDSYWKKMYTLPIIFYAASTACAAAAFALKLKRKELLSLECAGMGLGVISGLFMFVSSLVRLITLDYNHLYYTSESKAWLGIGTAGRIFPIVYLILCTLGLLLDDKIAAAMNKPAGATEDPIIPEEDEDINAD